MLITRWWALCLSAGHNDAVKSFTPSDTDRKGHERQADSIWLCAIQPGTKLLGVYVFTLQRAKEFSHFVSIYTTLYSAPRGIQRSWCLVFCLSIKSIINESVFISMIKNVWKLDFKNTTHKHYIWAKCASFSDTDVPLFFHRNLNVPHRCDKEARLNKSAKKKWIETKMF